MKERTAQLEQQKEEITMQAENLLQQKEEIESIAENLKGANEEIQGAYQDFQVLSEIGQKITSSLEFNSILELIYTSVNELMPAEVFGIGLYDADKQEIVYKLAVEKGQRYKPYTRDAKEIASVLAVELSKHIGQSLTVASAEFVEPTKAELKAWECKCGSPKCRGTMLHWKKPRKIAAKPRARKAA